MTHVGLKHATIAHIQPLTNDLENCFEKQGLKKTWIEAYPQTMTK